MQGDQFRKFLFVFDYEDQRLWFGSDWAGGLAGGWEAVAHSYRVRVDPDRMQLQGNFLQIIAELSKETSDGAVPSRFDGRCRGTAPLRFAINRGIRQGIRDCA
jgi:hypothetical protein